MEGGEDHCPELLEESVVLVGVEEFMSMPVRLARMRDVSHWMKVVRMACRLV